MKLFYTPQAQDQLQAILRYIAFHNPEAAVRVLALIRSVAEQLPNFPHMGHESVMRETAYEYFVPFSQPPKPVKNKVVLSFKNNAFIGTLIPIWQTKRNGYLRGCRPAGSCI